MNPLRPLSLVGGWCDAGWYRLSGDVPREVATPIHGRHYSINKIEIHLKTVPNTICWISGNNSDNKLRVQPCAVCLKKLVTGCHTRFRSLCCLLLMNWPLTHAPSDDGRMVNGFRRTFQ
ncbi:hypothetical protein TNCV_1470151 [Trichonephila clavipes]|nr:hypothetical protein TNCV_1470151 [Trichonephila clavipes]